MLSILGCILPLKSKASATGEVNSRCVVFMLDHLSDKTNQFPSRVITSIYPCPIGLSPFHHLSVTPLTTSSPISPLPLLLLLSPSLSFLSSLPLISRNFSLLPCILYPSLTTSTQYTLPLLPSHLLQLLVLPHPSDHNQRFRPYCSTLLQLCRSLFVSDYITIPSRTSMFS